MNDPAIWALAVTALVTVGLVVSSGVFFQAAWKAAELGRLKPFLRWAAMTLITFLLGMGGVILVWRMGFPVP